MHLQTFETWCHTLCLVISVGRPAKLYSYIRVCWVDTFANINHGVKQTKTIQNNDNPMKDVKCSVLRLRGFRASPFSLPVNSRNRILSIHAETFTQTYNACNSLLIDFFCRLSVTYLQSSSTHEYTHSLSIILTMVLLCDDCRSAWQIILHSSSLLISHDACVSRCVFMVVNLV